MGVGRKAPQWIGIAILAGLVGAAAADEPPYLTFGMFLGSVEEGARVFGPIELLPFDHPAAAGHEFPNPKRFHVSQTEILEHLGRQVGLGLKATLTRYPDPPSETWAYPGFRPPPVESILSAPVEHRPVPPPIPGLRVVAFVDGLPLAFILDTRGLSLADRGMQRPTTMGLDITREDLLRALHDVGQTVDRQGARIVTFARGGRESALSGRAHDELLTYWREKYRSPADYVVAKFEDHNWVFLGEYHRIRHDVELVSELIPRLHRDTDVRHLALEFLCRDRTEEANRLIASETLGREELIRFFREQFPSWYYEEYLDIFRTAWASNRERATRRGPFRLVGLNPCPNREVLNYGSDPAAVQRERQKQDRYDEIMAEALEETVLSRGLKALVYTGIAHATAKFTEYRYGTDEPLPRMGNLVYREPYRSRMFFIALHAPFWDSARGRETYPFDGALDELMAEFRRDIGFDVVDSPFETLSHRRTDRYSVTWYRFGELVDGYIIFRTPIKEFVGVTCIPDWIGDEAAYDAFRRNLSSKEASEHFAGVPFDEFMKDFCAPRPDYGVQFRRRFRGLPDLPR